MELKYSKLDQDSGVFATFVSPAVNERLDRQENPLSMITYYSIAELD